MTRLPQWRSHFVVLAALSVERIHAIRLEEHSAEREPE